MVHQRYLIRSAVIAALQAAIGEYFTIRGTRVAPWKGPELPAISVYTLNETSDDQQSAPRELKRVMQLAIEVASAWKDSIDDVIDLIALMIERVMHADPTFGGVCSDSTLTNTDIDVLRNGDQLVGMLRLTYKTTYYTDAPYAEDVVLVDLKTADVKYSLGGTQAAADQAEDKLEELDE